MPKQQDLFQTKTQLVIIYGGNEFPSVEAAKINALLTFAGVTQMVAETLVREAQNVAAILTWTPDVPAANPAEPTITDQQIADACKETGVDYTTAKNRMRRLGWNFEDATTTPVRPRKKSTPTPPANEPEA